MRAITTIVIHHTASEHATVEQIDRWHYARGFRRRAIPRERFRPHLKAIGYHFVIYRDGSIHKGRDLDEMGAHAKGANKGSVGICLVGNGRFTPAQWSALDALIKELCISLGRDLDVQGHRDATTGTKCPGFDVAVLLATGRPRSENVL